LFGGAAGGSKTWTGCVWLGFMCLCYPETRWFIGRADLQRIKKSTLVTFRKVAKKYNFKDEYKFHEQDSAIKFKNGSQIDLLNCEFNPSDDLYDRFGSTEYTGGELEEGGEIHFGAFDVLKTRIGRHLNDHYGITPKILITCNPKKNWMYAYFYKPFIENALKIYQKFLRSFITDNPHIDSNYIEQLKSTTDKAKKERLLNGNWDYDDNPYKMCEYDNILDVFKNNHIKKTVEHFITADIARFGSDYARIGVWRGWELIEVHSFPISKTTEIQACIEAMRIKYKIPNRRAIADEDGVGGGVVDNCNIIGFTNNAKPIDEKVSIGSKDKPNYQNLQTQCVYKLAEIINSHEMYISADLSETEKEQIKEELDTMEVDPAKQPVLACVSKKIIKENIGRSPDWRDMFMMRCYFDFYPAKQKDLSKFGFA
jgi:phage terminase large subunit